MKYFTKLELVLIAVVFIGLMGITAYIKLKPEPPEPPPTYQAKFDSIEQVLKLRDDSLVKLNLILSKRDTVVGEIKERWKGKREVARGADEIYLDSLIKEHAK